MSKRKAYDQADLDDVLDNPEWTERDMVDAGSFAEAFPELATASRNETHPKAVLSLPIDAEVIERFRATGPGWHERMNDALRAAVGLSRRRA